MRRLPPPHRWLTRDWRELSASDRFGRAKGRCEGCGRPHGRVVLHLGDGRWRDEEAGRWPDGADKGMRRLPPPHSVVDRTRLTRVVLATCHRDHDSTNSEGSELAALFGATNLGTTRSSNCAIAG